MKKRHIAVVAAILAAGAGGAYFTIQTPVQQPSNIVATSSVMIATSTVGRVGPDILYPNSEMTPGKADTLSIDDLTRMWTDSCPSGKDQCTYSQDHRNVPAWEHAEVYNEYAVPANERNIKSGEVDHFYPLCAGGSNDISNLWYQPVSNVWNGKDFGFHEKDKLESYICVQIKAGKLDPREAFDRIKTDWVAYDILLQQKGLLPASGNGVQ